jgi:hypothetical protein
MSSSHNAAMIGSEAATADISRPPGDVPGGGAGGVPLSYADADRTAARSRLPGDDDTPLTRWIVQHRVHIFVFAAVLYALAFNGQWRVGRDSALYRGLAHSLATGQGYKFTDFSARQIYPGLPVLLAGLEKVFGQRDWPPIVVIHLFSLGCLVVTYRLIRLRFPQWVAISVTACTAMNSWFLELTNEIRDDVPFLFGMLLALYGWERLRVAIGSQDAKQRARLVAPLVTLLIGLAVAAVMRPTFWILAIAWVLACVWGLVTGPQRKFYAISLVILVAVWLTVMAVDPRVSGFSPLAGGYERDARAAIANAGTKVVENVPQMLGDGLAYGFFGQKWAPGLTQLMNLAAIASSLLLLRRYPLWALLILLTIGVTVVMTPVPRYYVMVLPLMALSWLLLVGEVARRVPPKRLELAILVGLLLMIAPNVARTFKVIKEQRGGERLVSGPKWRDVAEMSRRVREIVPEGERVIGPWAPIMSYLSGREVVMSRDIIPPHKRPQIWPHHLEALQIRYAIFPAKLYDDAERQIRFLMDRGVIVPTARVARVGADWVLMEIQIDVPAAGKDWRKQPIRDANVTAKTDITGRAPRPSNEKIAAKKKRLAAERRAAAERRIVAIAKAKKQAKQARLARAAAAERAEAKARKKRQAARRAKAAQTQPAAATQPATRSSAFTPSSRYSGERAGERGRCSWSVTAVVSAGGYFDVGGFAGQSAAFFSDSICRSVNLREPWLIPWQRWPAASQLCLLASSPSQNGHVRHCSGRTS